MNAAKSKIRETKVMKAGGNFLFALGLASALLIAGDKGEWPYYGHDPGGQRFSQLDAINRLNVASLKIAWTFRTGDAYTPKEGGKPTQFEATPLYVDGTLYIGTPLGRVIALDPLTGKERWSYDPNVNKDLSWGDNANRGVRKGLIKSTIRQIHFRSVFAFNIRSSRLCRWSDTSSSIVADTFLAAC
jgi:glucose dehydrogenase